MGHIRVSLVASVLFGAMCGAPFIALFVSDIRDSPTPVPLGWALLSSTAGFVGGLIVSAIVCARIRDRVAASVDLILAGFAPVALFLLLGGAASLAANGNPVTGIGEYLAYGPFAAVVAALAVIGASGTAWYFLLKRR